MNRMKREDQLIRQMIFMLDDQNLSPQDIENASDETVDELLKRIGLDEPDAPHKAALPAELVDVAVDERPRTGSFIELLIDRWIVKRPVLVEQLCDMLLKNHIAILYGPEGGGKSHFWRADLRPILLERRIADYAIHIDCFALAMESPRVLEYEAVFAQFGSDEKGFHLFMDRVGHDGDPLRQFVEDKFAKSNGIVVFDHAERLADCGSITNWLCEFTARLQKIGTRCLIMFSGYPPSNIDTMLGVRGQSVYCDVLSESEIDSWWSSPSMAHYRRDYLDAAMIHQITGGWPRLVRDLGRFLADLESSPAPQTTIEFIEAFSYSAERSLAPELEKVIEVVRETPWDLHNPLLAKTKLIRKKLLMTGAIYEPCEGFLTFRSSIFSNRYRKSLMRRTHCLLMVNDYGRMCAQRDRQELISRCLSTELARETEPTRVFAQVSNILSYWGLSNSMVYARDPAHTKLWLLEHANSDVILSAIGETDFGKKQWPLYADKKPEFAQAVQSGRIVFLSVDEVCLPVIGESGRVEAVVVGKVSGLEEKNTFNRRHELRRLWRMVLALSPSIALALARQSGRRSKSKLDKFLSAIKDQPNDSNELRAILVRIGCSSVIEMGRTLESWSVTSHQMIFGAKVHGDHFVHLLDYGATERLDKIAAYNSDSGLVLDYADTVQVFPRFRSERRDTSLYVLPIRTGLAVFVFEGKNANAIDGDRQRWLAMIGRAAAASAA